MTRRARGRVVAVLTAAGMLTLAGCNGGGDDPTTSTTTTVTSGTTTTTTAAPTTATTTPTPTATAIPDAAKQKSKAGAEAFAAFFFASLNQAWTQPNAELLPPLCEATSKSCAAFQETARDLVSKKQRYRSQPFTAESFEGLGSGDSYTVDVPGVQNRVDVVNLDGSVALTDQRKELLLVLTLVWKGDAWSIEKVQAAA